MRLYLQTRGRNVDYAFLGTSPSEKWWLDFREMTSFEQPTILVRGDRSAWHAYASGIPSRRQDRVGTPISYTLVASGTCNEQHDGLLGLITKWIVESSAEAQPREVQDKFDNGFRETDVERLLLARGVAADEEVQSKIRSVLDQLRADPPEERESKFDSWIGAAAELEPRQEFVLRVSKILRGKHTGFAGYLNLIGTQAEAEPLVERLREPAAILIDDTARSLGPFVVQLKKNSTIQVARKAQQSSTRNVVLVLVGLGLLILLGLLIWFMIRHR